jgi:hypothetical protein
MKSMHFEFKENTLFFTVFCKDDVTVIKSIIKIVKIKNLYLNRSICYPEQLNVKKL